MLDILSGEPMWGRRLRLGGRLLVDHAFGRLHGGHLTGEEVLLQHIGQTGDADAEESDSSGGVHSRQQRRGDRADNICTIRRGQQRA